MINLTSLDIHNIIKELSIAERGRINKIFQEKNKFSFKIHTSTKNFFLNIVFPGLIFISEDIKYSISTPGNLCMGLRKYLNNALITSIEQYKSERIIKIVFQKSGTFTLFIEMFNKGNLALVREDKIIALYSTQNLKDRTIKNKLDYQLPNERCDFLNISEKEFVNIISNSKKPSIVLCLASEIGLGGPYSEEVCLRAGIDKNEKPSKLISKQVYKGFFNLKKSKIQPNIADLKLFSYDLRIYKEKKFFKDFSSAIEFLIKKTSPKRINPKIEKLKHIIETQAQRLKILGDEIKENKIKGEKIYENYNLLKQIYDFVEEYKNKKSMNEILDALSKHKKISQVNKKNRKITINV